MNHPQYEPALKAIEEVFGDTSVAPEDTLEALEVLRDDIEVMIEAVKSELP